ncbi:hypothetical protein ADIAL_1292 [Alkalibacterium sp. AK22]|nr:hypothetical protein ADIAL_1292 [Alkalibacterium sp. AK22]
MDLLTVWERFNRLLYSIEDKSRASSETWGTGRECRQFTIK